jgi:hypothetical protein
MHASYPLENIAQNHPIVQFERLAQLLQGGFGCILCKNVFEAGGLTGTGKALAVGQTERIQVFHKCGASSGANEPLSQTQDRQRSNLCSTPSW